MDNIINNDDPALIKKNFGPFIKLHLIALEYPQL